MRKKQLISMLIVVFLLVTSGCALAPGTESEAGGTKLRNRIFTDKGLTMMADANPAWLETGQFDETPSEQATVHLFFDGSSSMRGYAEYPGSMYERILISLNAVSANTFESVTVKSYKFFNQVNEMKDKERSYRPIGDDYVDFVHRTDFYGTELGVRSGEVRNAQKERSDYGEVIDEIIEINPAVSDPLRNQPVDDLFVIVSDFIPQNSDDTDFYRFASRLYSEIVQTGLCCGVAAFQSEFIGEIKGIDVTHISESIAYKGKMPFYLFVVGETANVSYFMNELDKKVKHYEIPEDEYGYFITDGQAPKDTGIGDQPKLVWEDQIEERLITGAKVDQMVSEELLETSAFVFEEEYSNQQVMTVFPIDVYEPDIVSVSGEITYQLPYVIAPTSGIDIRDEDWSVSILSTTVFGETEADTKELKRMDRQCKGLIEFPKDMSEAAFNSVYGGKLPSAAPGEDKTEAQRRTWSGKQATYDLTVEPRVLEEDAQICKLGDVRIEEGKVSIPITFDLNRMETEMPYLVSMNVITAPCISIKPMEEWVFKWNFDSEDAFDWIFLEAEFPGYGTPNLVNALKSLQGDNIYVDGEFTRQINLIISKSEILASDAVSSAIKSEAEELKKQEEAAKKAEVDANSKKTGNAGDFNIFKGGNKDE